MNWVLNFKRKLIVLLGGYTRDEVEKLYFAGIKDGRLSVDSFKFKTNYFNPPHVLDEYDKTRSNRNC
jgi:hypothetical protein